MGSFTFKVNSVFLYSFTVALYHNQLDVSVNSFTSLFLRDVDTPAWHAPTNSDKSGQCRLNVVPFVHLHAHVRALITDKWSVLATNYVDVIKADKVILFR